MSLNLETPSQFGNLELLAKQVVEGFITGMHKSPFHGFSVEFSEHKAYQSGDALKTIDWKVFAKTDKLFTKKYEEETNLRCHLIIDNSSSMYYPNIDKNSNQLNKIKFSILASASIMQLLKKQRDAVGLNIFNEEIETMLPAKSSNVHYKLLYNHLEKLFEQATINKTTHASNCLHQIAEKIHRRSLVIIFSDMFEHALSNNSNSLEHIFSALQHLRHNKHEVILFHTIDKSKEVDFDFENRPYTFVDTESGEQVKLHAHEVKDYYVEQIQQFKKELMLKCGQYKIDFIEADINNSLNSILMAFLAKRAKMV